MIVKMKEINILISEKDSSQALWKLRKLGIMHIEPMCTPTAHYITYIEQRIGNLEKALAIIPKDGPKKLKIEKGDLATRIKEIIDLDTQRKKLIVDRETLRKKSLWYQTWGDVSLAVFNSLKKYGIFIKLYICGKKYLKRIPEEKLVFSINRKGPQCYIAYLAKSPKGSLDLEEVEVPAEDKRSIYKAKKATVENLNQIDHRLRSLAAHRDSLIEHKKELLKGLEFSKAKFSMSHAEGISALRGFCPQELVSKLEEVAQAQGWAIISKDPEDPNQVPTLIRNPKWVEIIKPIFKFMGTLPGYGEHDISFWFLLFFSLFFAMLIGDAGYGLVLFGLTVVIQNKLKTNHRQPFFLMYVLSLATIIWGAMTGTWFGAERIAQLPFFNSLVIDKVNSFVGSNQTFMIYLCFLIGAVQLSIAHGIRAFRYLNSLIALAQIGWILIVWTAFFIAGGLVLNKSIPQTTPILGIAGASLVVLFSNPQKNILKGILISLADFPLSAIGSFSDVVSYLRLFAVGYATVAVASTFNSLALSGGISSFLGGLIAALILFLGHSLNIILGLMAVIVHGIRLNMLEFSGHLNMQWSGREYKPFKE